MNVPEVNQIPQKPSGSILLVEDEPNLAFTLELNLRAEGYDVPTCMDGDDAEKLIRNADSDFDLYLLDVNLPGRSGFEIAQVIREKNKQAGIIFLTARASESDSVRGLSLGADDYITKPFRLAELLLKVKRTLARCAMFESGETVSTGTLTWGPFELDPEKLLIKTPTGQSVLTRLEADMLKEFFLNPDRVLSRQHLLAKVWGVSEGVETRTVDNFVVRLRRLIETNPTKPRYLKSIRGRGYVLAP